MREQQAGASPAAIACPFCGLGCDDLSPSRSTTELSVDSHGCLVAETGFVRALSAPRIKPRVDGQDASLEDALARTAQFLREASLPLFAGLCGDLADMRGALRLAECTGGAIDHRNGDALMTNLSVLEESGWIVTSLGEARNRADLLVLVGDGLLTRFPRLAERVMRQDERLHTESAVALVRVGSDPAASGAAGVNIPVPIDQIRDFIGVLRGRLANRPIDSARFPQAAKLAGLLDRAKYPVIAFAASAFGAEPHADLIVRALAALVRDLNGRSRAALLPLGGADGETSAHQVSSWHTGFSIRQSFHTGVPEYRPRSGATRQLLDSGGVDLLVWISTLNDAPPTSASVPTLILGHPAMKLEREPEVFIPLAVPGVHRAGAIHRGDGLAMLPLTAIADSTLPESAAVFARLLDLVAEEQRTC